MAQQSNARFAFSPPPHAAESEIATLDKLGSLVITSPRLRGGEMPVRLWVLYVVWFLFSASVCGISLAFLVLFIQGRQTFFSLPAIVVGLVGGAGLLLECIVGIRFDMKSLEKARSTDAH